MDLNDAFFEKFKPLLDHTGRIRKFACEGSDLNIVRQMEPECIWTIVNRYDGTWVLAPGYKRAGREYFVICDQPYDIEEVTSDDWEEIIWHSDVTMETQDELI